MDIFEQLANLEVPARAVLADIQTFEAPLPDYLMLGTFVILLFALHRSSRAGVLKFRTKLEEAYQQELLTANRRMHQARGDLRRLQQEMERERQRKRGALRENGRFGSGAERRRHDAIDRSSARAIAQGTVPFKAASKNRNQTRPIDPVPANASASHDNLFLNGVEK
ncbi:hypothetical protein [uncultured Ruegeria sp.]|jgi:hypothetical protein|uniref:hypothetical protein n=1 Tax=uncultured Ruegeria sp. TaxID=259304 RepID=UPI00262F5DEA|nr:hypothetical protein [uncultured Ruegeria sp.]